MTGKSLWQQIKDVVDCDKKITGLVEDIKNITKTLDQDRVKLTNYQVNLDASNKALFMMQKNVQLQEFDSKELKSLEDRKRKQLDNAKGQKEYKGLEREIERVQDQRTQIEELVVKQWYEVDRLKAEVKNLSDNQKTYQAQLTKDIENKEASLKQLETKHLEFKQERSLTIVKLPAEWISKYERMKESVADPIVPVVNDNCSSCYYSILHQDLSKLRKAQVLICRSCYRFLYYDTVEEKQCHEASY